MNLYLGTWQNIQDKNLSYFCVSGWIPLSFEEEKKRSLCTSINKNNNNKRNNSSSIIVNIQSVLSNSSPDANNN